MPNRFLKNSLFPGLLVLFVGILVLTLRTCKPNKLPNGKAIADEMERHLVKHITGPMINQETRRVGDSLIQTAEQHMRTYLKTTLDSGNAEAAAHYRDLAQYTPLTEMARKYLASLGRTAPTWANSATDPVTLMLQQQLQQYAAFNQQKQPLQPQVLKVGQELVYTKPIFMKEAVCQRCHSQQAQHLPADLQKNIPAAQKGYRPGSWAGMWYVRFQAKGILDSITQKRKKSRRGQPIFSRPDSVKN